MMSKYAQPTSAKISPLKDTLLSCKLMLRYALLFGCIANILMLATPLYSMQVLDRVISSGNLSTLTMLTLVIASALLLLGLIQGARSFAMIMMGAWIEKRLSPIVFSNSVKMALEIKGSGGSQQMRDLQTIKTYLTSPQLITILDTPWAIIFIIVLFMLHTYMGVLAIFSCAFLIFMGIISDRITKPLHDANNENFIRSMRQVEQANRNAEVVEVMGLLPNVIKSWQKLNTKVQTTQSLASQRQSVLNELTTFIRTVLQISVTGIGAYLVIHNEITSGTIIASSSLIGRALAPFQASIASWKQFVNFRKAYQRLENAFNHLEGQQDLMILPEPAGKLDVEGVFFAPPGSKKHTLKGISFSLNRGETLVIIGPSASGKTSLAKIIVGAWRPSIGAVRLDDASLTDWNREQLGKYIGYLPQDVELFAGTVRENIGRMDVNCDPEMVVQAAQLAGIHEMILQLPNGYDTQIGDDGSSLSGGQRQRIALARALYGDVKLLVLDEPNASLDSQGEEALSLAIEVAKEKKITTVLISHRPTILNLADKILVVRDGAVALFGNKQEVMAQLAQASKPTQPGNLLNKNSQS
jgi:PrtD family type I secretion system ABC transporter